MILLQEVKTDFNVHMKLKDTLMYLLNEIEIRGHIDVSSIDVCSTCK